MTLHAESDTQPVKGGRCVCKLPQTMTKGATRVKVLIMATI